MFMVSQKGCYWSLGLQLISSSHLLCPNLMIVLYGDETHIVVEGFCLTAVVAGLPSLRGGTVQVPEHAVVQEGYNVDSDECHLLQSSNILLSIISFYPLLSSIIHNKTIYNNPLIQYHIIRKYSLLSRNIHTFPNSYPIHNFPEISTKSSTIPLSSFIHNYPVLLHRYSPPPGVKKTRRLPKRDVLLPSDLN